MALQLWLGFDPSPRNLCMLRVQPKKQIKLGAFAHPEPTVKIVKRQATFRENIYHMYIQ